MSWLRRIRGRSRREKVRYEKNTRRAGAQETVVENIKKGDFGGLDMWSEWKEKDYQSRLNMNTWREREAGDAKEDLYGHFHGRPEGEKHRVDHVRRPEKDESGGVL